jgi:adenylate kinase family enzyme
MPLKIAFVGNSLAGKTTISQKLSQKFGIIFINPVSIISEAFELNKEPVAEDPKKKKDSKKPEE